MLSRRQLLAGIGGLSVIGFDPIARVWTTKAHAAELRVPSLDGTLLTDPSALSPYAQDVGNIIHRTPLAVLRPGSVRDIQVMIRFCRARDIKVAARGQGHTTHGQSQVRGGLVIDMAPLNAIHAMGADWIDVGAGLLWSDLVRATVPMGLTPPVLTGYLDLSIGGTLTVGGVSPTPFAGAQVDHVRELEVVTGEGDLVRCSPLRNRELFESVLAGLGQYGIITRARIELVPAPELMRTYVLRYTDNAQFFADFRKLLARGELDQVYNMWVPDGEGGWIYQLTASKGFSAGAPPDAAQLLRDLSVPASSALVQDAPYLDHVLQVVQVINFFKQAGLWEGFEHPWLDVFLPNQTVERYVGDVIPTLTSDDVGPAGFMLLFAMRTSDLHRPRLRVPQRTDWVYLFDILSSSPQPGPNPDYVARMMERNRRLFEKARRMGGTRYPIGSLDFSKLDWALHYGFTVDDVLRAKLRFDPSKILAPGYGIFS